MTLTFKLDLDILPLDLNAKIQAHMLVCSPVTARHADRQMDRWTVRVKTITPVADAECKNDI